MPVSCDLFCRVVDNLGDAGICWRLARQLVLAHGWQVRLWIDDLQPLASLCSGIDMACSGQKKEDVEICLWPDDFPEAAPHQVVIEAFACELPPRFVAAMARQVKAPVWINLEYLSAENWVADCHGLPSPHPSLPLVKYFFFPGFQTGSGGLLGAGKQQHFSTPRLNEAELRVSLFCYDNPALPDLLDFWVEGDEVILCQIADGLPRQQIETWLGEVFPLSSRKRLGNLKLVATPFVPQADYDVRLADCDLNFVRGEDSFVRAQWAERPFVWQIYPQKDAAHLVKLNAFLVRYLSGLDFATQTAVTTFWNAWNGSGKSSAAWPAFRNTLPRLATHGQDWARALTQPGDLAQNLVNFCQARL
jgi:uncharacterized repeat protein (TIGR03837 family)